MRREYDFSKGVRGKFYRPDAKLLIPVYLEPEVQTAVAERATKNGVGVSEEVNRMLRREISAEPAQTKKASSGSKRSAQLVLLGTDTLRTKLSSAGTKTYAVREATDRFKDIQTYRANPTTRVTSKARSHAAKKSTKRAKR